MNLGDLTVKEILKMKFGEDLGEKILTEIQNGYTEIYSAADAKFQELVESVVEKYGLEPQVLIPFIFIPCIPK
jgi:hypothetical protein